MKFYTRFLASFVVGYFVATSTTDFPTMLFRCVLSGIILGLFFAVLDAPTRKDFE